MANDLMPMRSVSAAHAHAHDGAVATFLTPAEQQRVDAAGEGCYTAVHRDSLDDVLLEMRSRPVSAVIVSVARYQIHDAPHVARLVREFPSVPTVALLAANEPRSTHALLALGQQGVRALADVRDPRGWRDLRQLVSSERGESVEQVAVTRIRADLPSATADCHRFFERLFFAAPGVTTIRQLTADLDVLPSTFTSRFFRAQLPAPKRYLAAARLVRAARLFENAGHSITNVAHYLEYSSPQSFSRHVQTVLSCSALEFRQRFTGLSMLERMRDDLILPYRDALQRFEPFVLTPQWSVLRASSPREGL